MENRVRLRVQKKKPIKRSRRTLFLKKIYDYLKSDTFMYAPFLSPLPSHFPSPNALLSSAKVVELKEPVKERRWLLKYLKSDVYMYDPLLRHPPSPQEPRRDCGMKRMNDSTTRLAMKVNQQTESHLSQINLSDQHTSGHRETLKHTVYQSCRSTSEPSKGIVTLNSQLRAHT